MTTHSKADEAIWIEFSENWLGDYAFDQVRDHFIKIKGTFDKDSKGPEGEYAGTLKNAMIVAVGDVPPNEERLAALRLLRENNLELKKLHLDGFQLHFNCDSIPFLKKTTGDTTRIWTTSEESCYYMDNLKEDIKPLKKSIHPEKFGKTQYIDVNENGRVSLVTMHETTFVKRNDSLYHFNRFIKPKLIFHPGMFIDDRKSIKLEKKYNYKGDSIVLGRSWVDKGLKHYYIIVMNHEDNELTQYSFTFDENLRFIYWEDCKN